MTPSHAKRLCLVYVAMGGEERQTERDAHEYGSLMRDLRAIIEAPNDGAAGRAIRSWGCWGRTQTAAAWARRFREAYRTGKLDLWREKNDG